MKEMKFSLIGGGGLCFFVKGTRVLGADSWSTAQTLSSLVRNECPESNSGSEGTTNGEICSSWANTAMWTMLGELSL